MGAAYGYTFYVDIGGDILTFPITPGELSITIGSNNKVVTLISEGDVNILKSPSLVEIEFEARFPMRKFPYSRTPLNFKQYFDKLKQLKEDKKSFRFIVARETVAKKRTWDTNLLVALENLEINENADQGDDVLLTFTLKQYKEYGVKTISTRAGLGSTSTSTSNTSRSTDKGSSSQNYTVQSGDCLWNIAKAAYGDGSKWTVIYEANKSTIEAAAKDHGKSSSSNGHWIYSGTKLTIPDTNTANLTVQKLNNSSSSSSKNTTGTKKTANNGFSGSGGSFANNGFSGSGGSFASNSSGFPGWETTTF